MSEIEEIIEFVRAIGIELEERCISGDSFLPGVAIERGRLVVDREHLLSPGDVLHEAGHLAVTEPSRRSALDGDLNSGGGEEMAAIAWSYAAIVHLGIDPSVLFHEAGYKGDSSNLIENFGSGRYIGVPLLEWFGMTAPEHEGDQSRRYPRMISWLRDSSVEEEAVRERDTLEG